MKKLLFFLIMMAPLLMRAQTNVITTGDTGTTLVYRGGVGALKAMRVPVGDTTGNGNVMIRQADGKYYYFTGTTWRSLNVDTSIVATQYFVGQNYYPLANPNEYISDNLATSDLQQEGNERVYDIGSLENSLSFINGNVKLGSIENGGQFGQLLFANPASTTYATLASGDGDLSYNAGFETPDLFHYEPGRFEYLSEDQSNIFSHRINLHATVRRYEPNKDGYYALSVNGWPADEDGNIPLPLTNGTVTNVSATNGTGITWSIQNATTTPNISLSLTKAAVGLSNVDNTSDANKPVSTAQQNALNLKENLSNKVTSLASPNNTTYPTTQAVANSIGSINTFYNSDGTLTGDRNIEGDGRSLNFEFAKFFTVFTVVEPGNGGIILAASPDENCSACASSFIDISDSTIILSAPKILFERQKQISPYTDSFLTTDNNGKMILLPVPMATGSSDGLMSAAAYNASLTRNTSVGSLNFNTSTYQTVSGVWGITNLSSCTNGPTGATGSGYLINVNVSGTYGVQYVYSSISPYPAWYRYGVGAWSSILKLQSTYSVTATAVAANSQITLGTVTITGATVNQVVNITQPVSALIYKARITAANTATIYAVNPTTASITTAAETINLATQ